MKQYDRLIFVSNSDTALGPMAEAIMQSKYLLDEMEITSRGAVVLFPEPINPKAEVVLNGHGMTMEHHMSAPLLREDFDSRTLILAMSGSVLQKLTGQFEETEDFARVLNEFVGMEREVADPYGGAIEDYEQSFAQLETMLSKLVVQLNEEELLC